MCTSFPNCMQIDLVQCNISQLQSQSISLWADVVIMNPPFGTRRKGADLEFLRAAFQVRRYMCDMNNAVQCLPMNQVRVVSAHGPYLACHLCL